ncbi:MULTISPECIES: helix-turn-helix transcriptional regulator [Hungatella]|uniref:helix-turn-helix domain-containing protein n=1 Tax=Hungatella TaxID=1649459 RepID=UPI00164E3D14|nr:MULTISPECIES: helix-turn-helix transcriptional regulator [Hungatella]MBC5700002.1 helix-turn-helix transcriptional regulator [Hungatella sp. L36]
MQDRKEFVPGTMGDRIAYLRKRKKLTQAQLAEQLGISAQAVSKWESGVSQTKGY